MTQGIYTPAVFVNNALLAAAVTLAYQVPTVNQIQILGFTLNNNDVIPHVVTVYFGVNQSAPSSAQRIGTYTLAPGQSVVVGQALNQFLNGGQTIQMGCDVNGVVSAYVSGLLIS